MTWMWTTFFWYITVTIIGVIFIPTARFLFPTAPDKGYPFAKTIGIILVTYVMFVAGTLHLAAFTSLSLYFLLALFAVGNIWLFRRQELRSPLNLKLIILEEVLFLAALFALAFMRGQEPSIHGLEKFMDYGFMESILRSRYFPPADMWYVPLPINYYYFGHMTGAMLIRLSGVLPSIGYNLILATIFAQGITLAFSLSAMIVDRTNRLLFRTPISFGKILVFGLLGTVLVNTIGNLHTIYLFTKGYPNDSPIPFWKIMSWYTPDKYWYPNATRFIPFTIHEFPSYSYVVADLHGHVFDIPFVLLTLALLYTFYMNTRELLAARVPDTKNKKQKNRIHTVNPQSAGFLNKWTAPFSSNYVLAYSIMFGFMVAIHYMTNAFDGPIYYLLTAICFFLLYKFSIRLLIALATTGISFLLFSLPFSVHFKPFATGIGVNCSPDFLVKAFAKPAVPGLSAAVSKLGPFLFEKGNCQVSPPWMLFILWGFYLVALLIFLHIMFRTGENSDTHADTIPLVFFILGFFMIVIPEFFYIKDIYPQHFRANTMFKLGYQAFIMMSIASMYVFYRISLIPSAKKHILKVMYLFFFVFVFVYPFYSVPSYYGKLDKTPQLDGSKWLADSMPQDYEIVTYLNNKVPGQPVILEAQGDSYTDYERISSFTGLPTVAGWWVHEWLWRGTADVVGSRIPEINDLYQSHDLERTRALIDKYNITYIVVSNLEREKYKDLYEKKFEQIGKKVFTSTNGFGALYKVK